MVIMMPCNVIAEKLFRIANALNAVCIVEGIEKLMDGRKRVCGDECVNGFFRARSRLNEM